MDKFEEASGSKGPANGPVEAPSADVTSDISRDSSLKEELNRVKTVSMILLGHSKEAEDAEVAAAARAGRLSSLLKFCRNMKEAIESLLIVKALFDIAVTAELPEDRMALETVRAVILMNNRPNGNSRTRTCFNALLTVLDNSSFTWTVNVLNNMFLLYWDGLTTLSIDEEKIRNPANQCLPEQTSMMKAVSTEMYAKHGNTNFFVSISLNGKTQVEKQGDSRMWAVRILRNAIAHGGFSIDKENKVVIFETSFKGKAVCKIKMHELINLFQALIIVGNEQHAHILNQIYINKD